MQNYDPVGPKLKALRLRTGLSVGGMASAVGVPKSTYQSRESSSAANFDVPFVQDVERALRPFGLNREEIWRDLLGAIPREPDQEMPRSQAKALAWELSQVVSDLVNAKSAGAIDASELAAEFLERAEQAFAKRGI